MGRLRAVEHGVAVALPTLEKTWQHTVNTTVACDGSSHLLLAMKNALKSFGTLPWTVWGSCRGVVGGYGNNDGVDRWANSTNVVMGIPGSLHSWFVLTQNGLGTGAAVCLEYNWGGLQSGYAGIIFFPTGVGTNGTEYYRPTATNEIALFNPGLWGGVNGAFTAQVHALQSTDGQCTRFIVCRSNVAAAMYIFDKPKNPVAAWTLPQVAMGVGTDTNSDRPTYATLNNAATAKGRIGSVASTFYMTSEGWGSSNLGQQITFPDDDTAEYPLSPIYVASETLGVRGAQKGALYDIWWGSTTPQTGETYPADGSNTFAQFGDLVVPWNGSIPLIA